MGGYYFLISIKIIGLKRGIILGKNAIKYGLHLVHYSELDKSGVLMEDKE